MKISRDNAALQQLKDALGLVALIGQVRRARNLRLGEAFDCLEREAGDAAERAAFDYLAAIVELEGKA